MFSNKLLRISLKIRLAFTYTLFFFISCILIFTVFSLRVYREINRIGDEELFRIADNITDLYHNSLQNSRNTIANDSRSDYPESDRAVLEKRFPNPFMPDTPQRIATDTSQKIAIRFGETIKSYMADPEKNAAELKAIPLVLAGWLRYLKAVDDEGKEMTCSSDPMLAQMQAAVFRQNRHTAATANGSVATFVTDCVERMPHAALPVSIASASQVVSQRSHAARRRCAAFAASGVSFFHAAFAQSSVFSFCTPFGIPPNFDRRQSSLQRMRESSFANV